MAKDIFAMRFLKFLLIAALFCTALSSCETTEYDLRKEILTSHGWIEEDDFEIPGQRRILFFTEEGITHSYLYNIDTKEYGNVKSNRYVFSSDKNEIAIENIEVYNVINLDTDRLTLRSKSSGATDINFIIAPEF